MASNSSTQAHASTYRALVSFFPLGRTVEGPPLASKARWSSRKNRPKPPISAAIVAPTLRIAWLSLKPRQSARATKRSQCRSTAALVRRRRRAKYLFREELHGVDPLRPQRLGQDFRVLVCRLPHAAVERVQ